MHLWGVGVGFCFTGELWALAPVVPPAVTTVMNTFIRLHYSPGSVLREYHTVSHLILPTTLRYQYYYSLLSQMRKPRVSSPKFTAVKMQGAFLAPSCPSSPSEIIRSRISALELHYSCKPLYQQKLFAELSTAWSLL